MKDRDAVLVIVGFWGVATLGLFALGVGMALYGHLGEVPRGASAEDSAAPRAERPEGPEENQGSESELLEPPTGEPVGLTCAEARQVLDGFRRITLSEPVAVPDEQWAKQVASWLDPHGFWAASPDAPLRGALQSAAPRLRQQLAEAPNGYSLCGAADELGVVMQQWIGSLRPRFDAARARGRASPRAVPPDSYEGYFPNDPVTQSAEELVARLGEELGSGEAMLGADTAELFEERFLPRADATGWSHAILAAAVRTEVALSDPHGSWTPSTEEAAPYLEDGMIADGERLWHSMARTPVGAMVLEPNVDALDPGDLVIAVDGVALGGLAYDQVEQAGLVGLSGGMGVREVLLWRARASALEQVAIPEPSSEVEAAPSLETLRIATSGGVVLALHVPEVRDDFAAQLEAALAAPALQGVAGILVDLRGNAGGSLEAARDAAGLWIGTAPVAVLRRRNGETEVLRSSSDRAIPELPVAVLVDGDTASAAEVFAGALRAHGVATLVGTKTFGKGCAQQYLRDAAGRGVLRVTTDVISLADGSALQQVGLSPDLELASEAAGEEAAERESDRPGVPQSWSGPALIARAPEPRPWGLGRPRGACPEPGLCRALSALAVHRGVRVR